LNEIVTVFSAEFMRRLRSRIYVGATLAGAFFIALIIEAPIIFGHLADTSTDGIVLAGPAPLRARAATLLQRRKAFRVTSQLDALPKPVTAAFLDRHGKAAAAIAISEQHRRLHLDVYARDLAAFDEVDFRSLVPLNIELATGIQARALMPALRIDRTVRGIDHKFVDTRSAAFAHAVASGLIFVLYVAIIFTSQSIMASVAEEKTSRIAEILIATISPVNLLTGKVLAAALLAIIQIAVWVATAALLFSSAIGSIFEGSSSGLAAADAAQASRLDLVDPRILIAFTFFFILGYLQYATVFAAAASLVSRVEDLASVSTPVMLPVIGALFAALYALSAPETPLSITLSFVPFVGPFVMFARYAVENVPAWELGLAVAVNTLTVAAAFVGAGKVYQVGMLLYGKPPSFKQIVATLRA
jgi:ABC-type Na+ efflux pump permease subunit